MISEYATNRQWSDMFIPAIRKIVGPIIVMPAPENEDMNRATDLMLFTAKDVRIAARVRRYGYAARYPGEFTVRHSLPSGATTELAKLIEGYGDWMFYGHQASPGSTDVSPWMLIDLHKWRAELLRYGYNGGWSGLGQRKRNFDGTSFMVFDTAMMPNIVSASSDELPVAPRQ